LRWGNSRMAQRGSSVAGLHVQWDPCWPFEISGPSSNRP
jgi:hypothetical protein